jgi:signal peptidase II
VLAAASGGTYDGEHFLMAAATAGPAGAAATAGVVVALDQATKQLVVAHIARGDEVSLFPGLELTNARNTGVAFGALEGGGLVVAILIGLALILLVGYFVLHRDMPWLWLPVGLLLGGALGNLADRAREGAVIDFIDPVAWPAFNLADACIVIGVLALLYVVEVRPKRAEAA